MKIHEFRKIWGDDYTFNPINGGRQGIMHGWKRGIRKGDYLILQNDPSTTRYQVEEISYYNDPPDMFRATVKFAPRRKPPRLKRLWRRIAAPFKRAVEEWHEQQIDKLED